MISKIIGKSTFVKSFPVDSKRVLRKAYPDTFESRQLFHYVLCDQIMQSSSNYVIKSISWPLAAQILIVDQKGNF